MSGRKNCRADARPATFKRIRRIVLLALAFSAQARALDVTLGGDAKLAEEYNTNLFVTPRPHPDAWGQGIDGAFDLSLADERWGSNISGIFNNRWYVQDNDLDYFNQRFSWKSYYSTERSRFVLNTQYNRESTLTTLADIAADLGYVFQRIPRTVRILSPSWSYYLTEKTKINLNYIYQDTTYDNKKNPGAVVDSAAHTGSGSVTHQLTERLQLTGLASYTDYALTSIDRSVPGLVGVEIFPGIVFPAPGIFDIPGVKSAIRTASIMAGFNYSITDTFDIAFSGGGQYNWTSAPSYTISTQADLGTGQIPADPISVARKRSDTLTEVFSAKASKRFESSDIGLDYSRSLSPNLQGQLITYDRYSIIGNHHFTGNLTTNLAFSYWDQTYPSTNLQANASRQILTINSTTTWQFDENWAVDATYQFRHLDFGSSPLSAQSHAIYLNLRYLFDQQKI